MRARRLSLLVVVAALLGACSSAPPERAAPEPPPATGVPSLAGPGPDAVADAAPAVVPAAEPLVAAPAPAPPAAPGAVVEDNPVPEGPAVAALSRAAPAGAAPAGAVQAASSKPAGKPVSTGRIEIPAIGLNHLTYEGIDLATIDYGPSHWPGTPLPGQRGNTVFPGHRTTHSRPFWDLDKLVVGNDVIFTTPAGRFTYKVTQTLVVNAADTWVVNGTPDATFTILGCHPKGSARQRYVVKGKLVGAPPTVAPIRPAPTTTTTRPRFLGIF